MLNSASALARSNPRINLAAQLASRIRDELAVDEGAAIALPALDIPPFSGTDPRFSGGGDGFCTGGEHTKRGLMFPVYQKSIRNGSG